MQVGLGTLALHSFCNWPAVHLMWCTYTLQVTSSWSRKPWQWFIFFLLRVWWRYKNLCQGCFWNSKSEKKNFIIFQAFSPRLIFNWWKMGMTLFSERLVAYIITDVANSWLKNAGEQWVTRWPGIYNLCLQKQTNIMHNWL